MMGIEGSLGIVQLAQAVKERWRAQALRGARERQRKETGKAVAGRKGTGQAVVRCGRASASPTGWTIEMSSVSKGVH